MNVLFLTIARIDDISKRDIYTDLMRKFRDEGHQVYIATPVERRYKHSTALIEQSGVHILEIWTLNLQKTNIIEKGIGTLFIEYQFLAAVRKYFSGIKFDLVLYSTPPITFTKVVDAVKKWHASKSYLLLKDIFPQNAVDLGLFRKDALIYRFFRVKERRMYAVSDHIGCMSLANVNYLCQNNPIVKPGIVEVNPNSIELGSDILTKVEKDRIRLQYGIPLDKPVFVYGGNLGKPQGIDFLIEVLNSNRANKRAFFVIVGSGTEYSKIKKWFTENLPANSILLSSLPQLEYSKLLQSCDVGMIFLDPRFTIPNYPCRLLSYLENKMPILAATDLSTDIGKDAEENGYGFWCESGNLKSFNDKIELILNNPELACKMGMAGYNYLVENFTVDRSFSTIMKHFNHLKENV